MQDLTSAMSIYRACHARVVTDFANLPEVPSPSEVPWHVYLRGCPAYPIGKLNRIMFTDGQPYAEILVEHTLNNDIWQRDESIPGKCYTLFWPSLAVPTLLDGSTCRLFPLYDQMKNVLRTRFPPAGSGWDAGLVVAFRVLASK